MQNRIKSQTQENNNASTLCYLHRMHLFLEIPKIICNSITHSCKNLNHVLDMTHFYIFRVHFYTKIATFQFLHLAFIFGNSKKDLIALIATELIILQKNMKCIYVMTNLYIFMHHNYSDFNSFSTIQYILEIPKLNTIILYSR